MKRFVFLIFIIFIFTSLSCSSDSQLEQVEEKNNIQKSEMNRRGPPPDRNLNRPIDKYSCEINVQGFCVFTGTPHPNGLNPNSEEIVNRKGDFLFSVNNAIAVNSSSEVLKPSG